MSGDDVVYHSMLAAFIRQLSLTCTGTCEVNTPAVSVLILILSRPFVAHTFRILLY